MKHTANTWKKPLGIVAVLVVLVAVATAAFFRSKPMLDPADSPRISLITADYWNSGETYHCDISQENIPQKLSRDLVSLFQGFTIRNTLFPRQNTYTVEPDSVYISIQVGLAEGSMRVNLSTNSAYTSAQFGDTHYSIVDGQDLYQKVYDRLSPLLVAHGSPGAPEGEPSPTPSQLPQTVPWEVPEQQPMTYEEYFEQEREYDFEDLDSAWFYEACIFKYEDGAVAVPQFWAEHFAAGGGNVVCGMYGINLDESMSGNEFEYLIADNYDPAKEIPDSFTTRTIPAHTWAVFPCTGRMPQALQGLNRQIFSEWLPANSEYKIAAGINVEMYSDASKFEQGAQDQDYYCEIWIPVEKK